MSRAPDPLDGPTVPQRSLVPQGDRAWIDRVIGGKYRVEGVLGRGGMGVVLKARHMRLDELVAIKVLHASLANDPDMAARMLREARAAVRLSSEHIVRVMDADTLEDGVPYLVLEYLEGTDVATLLRKRGGKLPMDEAIPIAEQACRALVEAHSLGIVHRDLKPANLFIVTRPDRRRVVKLVDFGVSKITSRDNPITRKGDIIGSPRYMAPEQVRGEAPDGRADIWSMGVVLYEMLSGKSPFEKGNFARTCNAVLNEPHEPFAALCPDLPPGLTALVDRCLEKDPARRVPDAAALRDALAPFGPVSMRLPSQVSLPEPRVAGDFASPPTDSRFGPPSGPDSAGLALSGAGIALSTAGPTPSSAGFALSGAGPALSTAGPAPSSAGPTLSTAGPTPSGAGPALFTAGHAPSGAPSSRHPGLSPDSFALAADVDGARTAIQRQRARMFVAIALAGLVLGLAAGVAVLVRDGKSAAPSASGSGTIAAALSTAAQAVTTGPASGNPASQPASAPPGTPSAARPGDPSGAPSDTPPGAPSDTPSAPSPAATNTQSHRPADPGEAEPSLASPAPARRPAAGASGAPSASATTSADDPFGERRH